MESDILQVKKSDVSSTKVEKIYKNHSFSSLVVVQIYVLHLLQFSFKPERVKNSPKNISCWKKSGKDVLLAFITKRAMLRAVVCVRFNFFKFCYVQKEEIMKIMRKCVIMLLCWCLRGRKTVTNSQFLQFSLFFKHSAYNHFLVL